MRQSEIEELARGLMRRYGLAEWEFAFNRRKRSLGLCRYTLRRIELSSHFALAHDATEVRDVILHEIAHCARGPRRRARSTMEGDLQIDRRPARALRQRAHAGRPLASHLSRV